MAADGFSDVIVAGGGPAGLAAALAIARAGASVAIVDPAGGPSQDRRTSALMAASVAMLEAVDVWPLCAAAAAPLRRIRIIDDTGRLVRAPSVDFSAEEIGETAFGWNVPNADLVGALRRRISDSGTVRQIESTVTGVDPRDDAVEVTLANGEVLSSRLVIAADGRNSLSRSAAGIGFDDWTYDQAAMVMNLQHGKPHHDTSTELHRESGPFTLVPLPGNRSSLVWVETRKMAEAISTFDDATLAEEIEQVSHRILGKVEIDGPRGLYPLSGIVARRYASRRVALVGEAAHVVPPIGAQGLNLGLRDSAAIAEIVEDAIAAGDDIGGARACETYDRVRRVDILSRTGAIDLMNRTLVAGFLPAQVLRSAGVSALRSIGPLRRLAMREGVAPGYRLPRLMRRDASASVGN